MNNEITLVNGSVIHFEEDISVNEQEKGNEKAYDFIYDSLESFKSELWTIRQSSLNYKSKENSIRQNVRDLIYLLNETIKDNKG